MKSRRKLPTKKKSKSGRVVIDPSRPLVFGSHDEAMAHFDGEISFLADELENAMQKLKVDSRVGIPERDELTYVLAHPTEIWEDSDTLTGYTLSVFISKLESGDDETPRFVVVLAYAVKRRPTFVFLQFATSDERLAAHYRRGLRVYYRSDELEETENLFGDALSEGDEFATALYAAMVTLRSPTDINEDEFGEYVQLREEVLDEPDEIWRDNDTMGNVLVTFVREFTDLQIQAEKEGTKLVGQVETDNEATVAKSKEPIYYLIVTIEESLSDTHYVLFSFPTNDVHLVDRYRHGENLQLEEFVREESH
ncbi:MAG: hypothetical protein COT74_12240 [Bdellovibrionales bacterium CG10_big_fil_rev_8_21_14_0_10_45_34]|nr:MAG: hypothetical protein COT74_12240 [Bdellovibrionales bacterium CG10_big_fil_rev_8_21_14_0_10_45_34]